MKDKRGQVATAWIDPSLPLVVKEVDPDGTTAEFRNIKEEAQPDNLFQVPTDYKKTRLGAPR
jgi:hypothetical protein